MIVGISQQSIATAKSAMSTGWRNDCFCNRFSLDQCVEKSFYRICRSPNSPQNFAFDGRSASFADCVWISHNSDGIVFHIAIITTILYTREPNRREWKERVKIMEKMRKLYICVYMSSNSLSIISICTAIIATCLLFSFAFYPPVPNYLHYRQLCFSRWGL